MPFHLQANPPSSQLPSMADRRMLLLPPGGPYSHTGADYRVQLPPLNLPPVSQVNPPPVNHPSTNFSHRYLIPPTPARQIGSNLQAHPLRAYDAAGFRGAGNTSNASSSAPAVTIGGHALIQGGDREVGKVKVNQPWINMHLTDLEVLARSDWGEEKGKVYLGVWLAVRELGLRDKESVDRFIVKTLMPYPWFNGETSIGEALRALHRFEYINCGLMAKKHAENAKWFWDKKIGDVSVRDYWIEEAAKQRQKAQAQAQAHAQAQAQAQA